MLQKLPEELLDCIGDYVCLRYYRTTVAIVPLNYYTVNAALAVVLEPPLQDIEAYLSSTTRFVFNQRRSTI